MAGLVSLPLRLALLLAVLVFSTIGAFALDEKQLLDVELVTSNARTRLQVIETGAASPNITNEKLIDYRRDLAKLRGDLLAAGSKLDAPINEIGEQLAKLPAPPAAGQAESADIAAQRKLLNDISSRLSGVQSQVKVLGVEVDQADAKILTQQRDRFFEQILEPRSSILDPSLWGEAADGLKQSLQRLSAKVGSLWTAWTTNGSWLPLFLITGALLLLFGVAQFVQRVWRRRFIAEDPQGTKSPDNLARLWRAFWSAGATFLMSWIVVIAIAVIITVLGIRAQVSDGLLRAIFTFIIEVPTIMVLIHRLTEPARPAWRLLPIGDAAARPFAWLAYVAAILAGLTSAMGELADSVNLPVVNSIAVSAVTSLAMLVVLALATFNLRDRSVVVAADEPATSPAEPQPFYNWAGSFRAPVWLCLIATAVSLLLGYIALASYLVFNVYYTLVVIALLFLMAYLVDAAVQSAAQATTTLGRLVRRATGWSNRSIERSGLLFRIVADLLLFFVGVPVLVGIWAVNWIDFRGIANKIFFSFQIGNVTISPWTILLVIGLFAVGISLTKLFTRWLDRSVLSQAYLDRGVQASVKTGISYVGYVLAGGFALTAAGIDFSSLALIAGALGVGVGLGLQSVVNNFVSGIILLAERPVRIGDWIVTGAGEGLVKRINVRSTEIETFDGCSIIVPNSDLIMEPVKNWTLGNTMGRAHMQIVVEYGQDYEAIRATLLKIISEHPQVLHFPEPSVILSKFLPYGVEFEMRGMVADIFQATYVSSDLRLAALEAFKRDKVVVATTAAASAKYG